MFRCGVLGLLLIAAACSAGSDSAPDSGFGVAGGAGPRHPVDSDGDGLCDAREEELGTDASSKDSDADGLPDLPELVNGFDPTDPGTPMSDQLGYLQARIGATADFPIRATIEGSGESLSGVFHALPSLDPEGLTAADFFRAIEAVSADPVDSVRSIDGESGRFGSVLGKTRLAFNLRFEYAGDPLLADELGCVRDYPFRFAIKNDSGRMGADRLFLLLVVPENTTAGNVEHCRPAHCQ